jgi:hypothetical protein
LIFELPAGWPQTCQGLDASVQRVLELEQEARLMKALKVILLVVAIFVLIRYLGVYQRATAFNRYVQEESSLVRSKRSMQEILLLRAEQDKLPITDKNIQISAEGNGLRVSVDYRVPLDLIVFQKELTFHSSSARGN